MEITWAQRIRHFIAARLGALPALWRESPPQPRAVRDGLDIPLHPSATLRRAILALLACELLYAVELATLGQGAASAAVFALFAISCAMRRMAGRNSPQRPRRLLISAAGQVHLLNARGDLLPAKLCRSSACLGPWLVLVCVAGRERHRMVFGPDNLEPAFLAALRRRLLALREPPGATWPVAGPKARPPADPGGR